MPWREGLGPRLDLIRPWVLVLMSKNDEFEAIHCLAYPCTPMGQNEETEDKKKERKEDGRTRISEDLESQEESVWLEEKHRHDHRWTCPLVASSLRAEVYDYILHIRM